VIVVDIINLSSSGDTLLRQRILATRARGIDNRILCMDGPYVPKLRELGIPVETVDLPRGLDPVRLRKSLLQIARYLRRERVDVVHTHCSVPGAIGRVAAWLAGVPVLLHTVHGFHFREDQPAHVRIPSLLVEQALGRITDTLLTQSHGDLALAEKYGIGRPGHRGRIGNGIDLQRFKPVHAAGHDGPPVILCAARFEPVKNHALLFDAAERLVARGRAFVLRLVGTGPLEKELRARAAKGYAGRIEFLGYRDDMPDVLAGADIAVLTSFKEGMPRAVLEAMAMGLPVVGTRVSGTQEAIRDGENGFLVGSGDADALANALETLIDDPTLRATMGASGRAIALNEFDEAPIAETLAKLYRQRLHAQPVPDPGDSRGHIHGVPRSGR
jgi:glycosyltransferase involved in cell wall biosynthesis